MCVYIIYVHIYIGIDMSIEEEIPINTIVVVPFTVLILISYKGAAPFMRKVGAPFIHSR